jgi:hypothetical protein
MSKMARNYERAFDFMLDEDSKIFNYLADDRKGRDALGALTEDD